MSGVSVCLLGDLDVRREFGKVGTQSDLHLHDRKEAGRDLTTIIAARHPEQVKGLSFAVLGADSGVLAVSKVDAGLGEQILAADAAGLRNGAVVLLDYVQPEQVQPLLAGTTLADWRMFAQADWDAVRAHIAATPPRAADGPPVVPVDHHFDVKGVGAVVLGVVRSGTLHKGDTLHAWPDGVICPVRSIQCHDVDVAQAVAGDRVGLALRNTKADQLDRGMVLAPADAPLHALPSGQTVRFRLVRSRFSKQPLAAGGVVHLGVGMQFVPVRLQSDAPGAGAEGVVEGVLERPLVTAPEERGVLWHMDSAQRVVGAVNFD